MTTTTPTANPLCYGCGKPISDELLAYCIFEMQREGGEPVRPVDHSVLCERCGDYSVAEAMESQERDTDTCPEHGVQDVTGYSATQGSDPYSVQHLACGHKVICLGPGDPNIII